MTIKRNQRVVKQGNSTMVTIPSQLSKGERCTLAADRIMIVDPRGEIPEEDLAEFLETKFWSWLAEKNHTPST